MSNNIYLLIFIFFQPVCAYSLDLSGEYEKALNHTEGDSLRISKSKKGNYIFNAVHVNKSGRTLIFENTELHSASKTKLISKECKLEIEHQEKGIININHTFDCGGIGTSIRGDWKKKPIEGH